MTHRGHKPQPKKRCAGQQCTNPSPNPRCEAKSTVSPAGTPGVPRTEVLLLPWERPACLPHLTRYRTSRIPQRVAPTPTRPDSTEQAWVRSVEGVKLRAVWLDGQTCAIPQGSCSPFLSAARFWGDSQHLPSQHSMGLGLTPLVLPSTFVGRVQGPPRTWISAKRTYPRGEPLASPNTCATWETARHGRTRLDTRGCALMEVPVH